MRKWFEPLSTSWIVVATHKLRSFLTVLGVVIGVAAVITLMSIGKGTQETILARFQNLGSNTLLVQPGFGMQAAGIRGAAGSATSLTLEDATAIANNVPYINFVAPFYSRSLQVVAGSQNMNTRVTGITPEYQFVYSLQTTDGDFISYYDYEGATKVVLLGSNVKQTLFGGDDAVGQGIRVGNVTALVIGVLQSKGSSMGSPDDVILIPLTTLQKMIAQPRTITGERVVNTVAISVSDKDYNKFVMDEITTLLRYRHKLADTADNDFSITSMEDLISAITQATDSMTLMLAAIAAISLLVGGIGVMNIMLVSVVERTREIGIRKALGAKERDIWGQFLIEAAFLTISGGIIGVALGWGASEALTRYKIMTTVVAPDTIVLAVSVSVAIGLFFGFYPAWQASRLNPIQALRAE